VPGLTALAATNAILIHSITDALIDTAAQQTTTTQLSVVTTHPCTATIAPTHHSLSASHATAFTTV